ncbi:hypothetical protein [Sulfurimonas sp.]|uniref:hypothetical protein n=1 Tax=Sulfurimonas sp. TaxID=2022749 RepID=UPI002AB294E7|nr:hypothetical protein [Sulfurimonas sp.]
MNEMYDMSIVTHNFGVFGILGMIFIHLFMLLRADDIKKYARFMLLFMPIGITTIGTVIFTGVIMMAAKHLDFTIENIIMIIFAIALIVLENKRSKSLQKLDKRDAYSLEYYKAGAYRIFAMEIFLTLSISIWMWI